MYYACIKWPIIMLRSFKKKKKIFIVNNQIHDIISVLDRAG